MRIAFALFSLPLLAAVTRIEIVERTDYAGGQSFGASGAYEQLRARAYFEADPNAPANAAIVDLKLAPRNERGHVEYAADIVVIKPIDPVRGNGTVLFEVSNRGGRGAEAMFHRADDHLLMERGFTLLWCGWQWDIPEDKPELLRLLAPVATDNGKPIRGLVRSEYTPNAASTRMWLGDRDTFTPYRYVADGKLTVRKPGSAARREIPASAWKVAEDGKAITMAAGFTPGETYEFVYTSENPRVAGLGPAAVRDIVSFFKYSGGGLLLTEQSRFVKRAIGFGTSQSGRFLRKFLYDGLNVDEKGRKVFDAVWPHVAGAGRGSFNHRFAQASRDGHPMMNFLYPTDLPPYDTESLLKKSREQNVVPKLFFTDGSYEYWGRGASLTHTTVESAADTPLPAEARRYYLTGTQHGAGNLEMRQAAGVANRSNANDYRFAMRALLVALNAWITTGKEPPKSAYPSVADRTLVAPAQLRFPAAVAQAPKRWHVPADLDFGPEFAASGVVTKEPPEVRREYAPLVPAVGPDGNELAGVRLPIVAVPLATYTGWNYRTAALGAAGEIFDMVGSTFPFAKERILALYKDKDDYLARTLAAGRALLKDGYVLEEDLLEIRSRAAQQWDMLTKQ